MSTFPRNWEPVPFHDPVKETLEIVNSLNNIDHHVTNIFPEDTNETVTFTAGDANVFSSWAEIVDNNTVTFTSKVTEDVDISAILIESASVTDKVFLIELSYGSEKTIITRYRFIAGETSFLPAIQQIRIRASYIPSGETIYYRLKCETGAATCTLHIRYFTHI